MPKATSKKKTASRVGGGGVGTRVSKLNLKVVIPIIAVIAGLGGFLVYRSFASSIAPYTLTRTTPMDAAGRWIGDGANGLISPNIRSATGQLCVTANFRTSSGGGPRPSYAWSAQEYRDKKWEGVRTSPIMQADGVKDYYCFRYLTKGATYRVKFYAVKNPTGKPFGGSYTLDGRQQLGRSLAPR